ncbi:MAG: patatin-like phospholipase family protein [Blastocatellia bacterium]
MEFAHFLNHPACGVAVGTLTCLLSIFVTHTKNPARIPPWRVLGFSSLALLNWYATWYVFSLLGFYLACSIPFFKKFPEWPLAFAFGLVLPWIIFAALEQDEVQEQWPEKPVLRGLVKILNSWSEKTFRYVWIVISREERKAGYDIEHKFGEKGKLAIDRLYERYLLPLIQEQIRLREEDGVALTKEELEAIQDLRHVNVTSIKIKFLLRQLGYKRLVREQKEIMADPHMGFDASVWPLNKGDRRERQQDTAFRRRATDTIVRDTIRTFVGQHKDSTPVVSLSPRFPVLPPQTLVMKGGGLKGIAYVGAIEVLEEYGYRFNHFVGTSAGAISAALLAVGYSTKELREVLSETDFRGFKDGWLPLSIFTLRISKGLYRGDVFTVWLENKLRQKFPGTFGAVPILFKHLDIEMETPNRLTIFTSTINKSAYCFDSKDPKDFELKISFACRCSMAIPYFFRPERINGDFAVDGGLQNNYPLKALLERNPELKESGNFLGLYLGHKEAKMPRKWMWRYLYDLTTEGGDEETKAQYIHQTIIIDPHPVKTTDFSLSPNDIRFLVAEGRASALTWLYHHCLDRRPSLEDVNAAQREVALLRKLTEGQRRRKLIIKYCRFGVILAMLLYGYLS